MSEQEGMTTTTDSSNATASATPTTTANTSTPPAGAGETTNNTASANPSNGLPPRSIADLKNTKAPSDIPTAPVVPALGTPNAPIAPAYTPNFKFKFLDADGKTRKELEIDEWARTAIKDADSEKKVREIFEKAYGLDYTKASRDKFKTEAETHRTENLETKRALNVLSGYVQNDDMDSFFESLQIPEEKVLKYALNRIQYRDLPPEKRAEYDQSRGTARKAALLEEQYNNLQQEFQQTQVQTRKQEFNRVFQDSKVLDTAQAYDQRMGRPGAFHDEVVKRGQLYWHLYKQDIPAEQAVNEVMQMVGMPVAAPQPAAQLAMEQPNVTNQVVPTDASQTASHAPEKKPVIPNIQGRGTSPAKKLPRSIKDLKALRAEAG